MSILIGKDTEYQEKNAENGAARQENVKEEVHRRSEGHERGQCDDGDE